MIYFFIRDENVQQENVFYSYTYIHNYNIVLRLFILNIWIYIFY